MYPAAKLEASNDEEENDEQEEDLEASIAKEVAAMKDNTQKKIFANIPTNLDCGVYACNNNNFTKFAKLSLRHKLTFFSMYPTVIFIRTQAPVEPVHFVNHILTDMKKQQVKKTRYISRLLPVETTCQANMEDIERVARQIVTPKFNTCNEDGSITSKAVSRRAYSH